MTVKPIRWQLCCVRCGTGLEEFDDPRDARQADIREEMCGTCEEETKNEPWESHDTGWAVRLSEPVNPPLVAPFVRLEGPPGEEP